MEDINYFSNYYVKTHMRISAYMVGIIMGAFIYDYKFATWRLPKMVSRVLFLQVIVMLTLSAHLGIKFLDPNEKPSLFEKALYACLHRPIFAFGICSIVLLITIGSGLGYIYYLFTPGWAQPISRLSYGIFLLHFGIQSYELGTARTAFTFSLYNLFRYLVLDIIYTLLLSLFSFMTIEGPFQNLGYLLLMEKKSSASDIKSSEISKKMD